MSLLKIINPNKNMIQLNTQNSSQICAVLTKVLESAAAHTVEIAKSASRILSNNFIPAVSKKASTPLISSAIYACKMKALYAAYRTIALARSKMLQGI